MKIDIFHKGLLSFAFVVVFGSVTMAQVKIGNNPTTLSPSAILEMESTNRGMLLPRLSLGSTVSAEMGSSTTKTAVVGMTVYNTNAGISGSAAYPANGAGIYYFDGTGWVYGGLPTGGTSGQILSRTATGLSWSDAASGIIRYAVGNSAGAGAIIKATKTGVTMSVDVATQTVTFTIPTGVELISIRMFDAAATSSVSSYGLASGTNILSIKYNFADATTGYSNTVLPQLQTLLDGAIPKYMDAVGNATNARKYVLTGAPSAGSYTVKIPLMDPSSLGSQWTILMNF
jgi:hypothetical protein